MKTLVLLSGGLDSATVLAICLANGDQCQAIGFDYSQPHAVELEHAKAIARYYKVEFYLQKCAPLFPLDDAVFAGRNLALAAHAICYAQGRFDQIAVGCNKTDHDRFPDCRKHFWKWLNVVTVDAYSVGIDTPLINMTKRTVAFKARKLGVPIEMTWSCYRPQDGGIPCGKCLACKVRREALA